jgi:toxin YhaV
MAVNKEISVKPSLARNGWTLLATPAFEQQLLAIRERSKAVRKADPFGWQHHPAVKLQVSVIHTIMDLIPGNPNAAEWRQGNTLGKDNRHWFRAKFNDRYRLFFRFSSTDRIIIYAWVNDEGTLRKSGSKSDPYAVFEAMLASGDPPSSWEHLLKASKELK